MTLGDADTRAKLIAPALHARGWTEDLSTLPPPTAATLRALTSQFARAGTDGLESPEVFRLPQVVRAGGLDALKSLGKPAEILRNTKARLFAA